MSLTELQINWIKQIISKSIFHVYLLIFVFIKMVNEWLENERKHWCTYIFRNQIYHQMVNDLTFPFPFGKNHWYTETYVCELYDTIERMIIFTLNKYVENVSAAPLPLARTLFNIIYYVLLRYHIAFHFNSATTAKRPTGNESKHKANSILQREKKM